MSRQMKSIFSATVFLLALPLFADAKALSVSDPQIEDVTQRVFPCVVKVEVQNLMRKVATGVVIDNDGHIVTTALISPRGEQVFITTSEGDKVEAEFLGMDSETHLAVVQAKDKKLTPIVMAKSRKLSPGAWIGVVSISPENTPQVTQGIVSSVADERVRLNVWVGRGMSGSPVVNKQGQMVGLLRGVYVDEQPIAFSFQEREVVGTGYVLSKAEAPASGMAVATPVDVVNFVATEIKEKGKVARGWLGVRIWTNEEDQVEIIEVEKDSPAEIADLEEGDVVVEFDGEKVVSAELLQRMIRMRKPGENVTLKIERDGKIRDVKVKLGELTEEGVWSDFERKFPTLFAPSKEKRDYWPVPEIARPEVFSFGFEQRKFIGVYTRPLNPELSEYFGVDKGTGLLIEKIEKDGPADKAGLKVGDVIIGANGKRVETTEELSRLIQDIEKGDKITIEYLRDKKKRTLEVEVEEEDRSAPFTLYSDQRQLNNFRNYMDTYETQSGKLAEIYKKRGEDQYRQFMENQKKMNEQWQKQWEKQQKDASKILNYTLKKKKGIRA